MKEDKQKPTIDERIEALTHNLELMQLDLEAYRSEQKRLDERERRGRDALVSGIAAYLQAIGQTNGA
jgi:hypothetical protein